MRKLPIIGAVVAVALVGVACETSWTLDGANVRSSILSQLADGFGLTGRIDGPITLKLLPKPRIRISRLSLQDGVGAVSADIPAIKGDLDVPALLRGVWRLSSATLLEPTFSLDLDLAAASALPVRLAGRDPAAEPAAFRLKIRNGVVRTAAHRGAVDGLLTDVDATIDRAAGSGTLGTSGAAVWRSTPVRFRLRLERPFDALRGREAGAAFQISSPLGSALGAGQVTFDGDPRFSGRVAASTQTLPQLLHAFSTALPLSLVERASLAGEGVARLDDITLSDVELKLEDTSFEGALAFHAGAGDPSLQGTLATDRLNADKLTDAFTDAARRRAWSRERLDSGRLGLDLDVRVSAGAMTLANVEFGETAASALVRRDRVELTVDEAHLFDGTLKSRVSADFRPTGVEAHAEVSVEAVDLAALSASLSGAGRVTGALSGRVEVDGRGERLGDIVRSLKGQAQLSVADGNFMGLSFAQTLRHFSRKLPVGAEGSGQITSFTTATSTLSIDHGIATISNGLVVGPGVHMSFGGQSDLPAGRLSITAVAAPTNVEGVLLPEGPRLPFEIRGFLSGPWIVDESRAFTTPGFVFSPTGPGLAP